MNKIKKFLKKLSKKELKQVLATINKIERGNLAGLNIKKLSSHNNIFRVRTGANRIIFLQEDTKHRIVSIERRN